jgi:hypothetical protein
MNPWARRAWFVLTPALVLSITLLGCSGDKDKKGDGKKPKTEKKDTGPAGGLQAIKLGNGVITGKVTLKGAEPDYAALDAAMTKQVELSTDKMACKVAEKQQQWMVDKETKGVKFVAVFLKPVDVKAQFFDVSGLVKDKKGFDPMVIIDQPHCQFEPRVVTVFPVYIDPAKPSRNYLKAKPTEQKFYVINSSPLKHNSKWPGGSILLNTVPKEHPEKGGLDLTEKVTPSYDMPVPISCDIHKWMQAYAWALPHPLAAVTNDKGEFKIENVPVGTKIRIVLWHEGAWVNGKDGEEIELKDSKLEKNFNIAYKK